MRSYRLLTSIVAPLIPLWLYVRQIRGKEDKKRIRERLGYAGKPRPKGTLLWLHAASVGEANSVLLLISQIRERFPQIHILMTTGTVTSATLMRSRLPAGVIHQYAPVDTPDAVRRFIHHWRPDTALWVESELWPNLVMQAHESQCFMGIINARMSEKSFRSWNKHPAMIRDILSCFDCVYAQSDDDAVRLATLGARDVQCVGNLKFDAMLLPYDENLLISIRQALGERPLWLAASTHPGEEILAAQAAQRVMATRHNLLTIIVPRHPSRGAVIAAELGTTWRVARRTQSDPVTNDTQIYIADTLGELGLFYRLCDIVFMGGSLVPRGGQNPLEAARLACGITTGPHTHNFADIYRDMEAAGACIRAKKMETLAAQVEALLANPAVLGQMQTTAKHWVETRSGATLRLLIALSPVFSVGSAA